MSTWQSAKSEHHSFNSWRREAGSSAKDEKSWHSNRYSWGEGRESSSWEGKTQAKNDSWGGYAKEDKSSWGGTKRSWGGGDSGDLKRGRWWEPDSGMQPKEEPKEEGTTPTGVASPADFSGATPVLDPASSFSGRRAIPQTPRSSSAPLPGQPRTPRLPGQPTTPSGRAIPATPPNAMRGRSPVPATPPRMASPGTPPGFRAGVPQPTTPGIPQPTTPGIPQTTIAAEPFGRGEPFRPGQPVTPAGIAPNTPAGAAQSPAHLTGAGQPFGQPKTPAGHIPATPAAAGRTPAGHIPATPVAAFGTPAGQIPSTAAAAFGGSRSLPMTPGALRQGPQVIPQTPAAAFQRAGPSPAQSSSYPQTLPHTPVNAGFRPSPVTPAALGGQMTLPVQQHYMGAPATPAAPGTPRGAGVAPVFNPAALITRRGRSPSPATPAQLRNMAPGTSIGVRPGMTPALIRASPSTPAVVRNQQRPSPMTPGGLGHSTEIVPLSPKLNIFTDGSNATLRHGLRKKRGSALSKLDSQCILAKIPESWAKKALAVAGEKVKKKKAQDPVPSFDTWRKNRRRKPKTSATPAPGPPVLEVPSHSKTEQTTPLPPGDISPVLWGQYGGEGDTPGMPMGETPHLPGAITPAGMGAETPFMPGDATPGMPLAAGDAEWSRGEATPNLFMDDATPHFAPRLPTNADMKNRVKLENVTPLAPGAETPLAGDVTPGIPRVGLEGDEWSRDKGGETPGGETPLPPPGGETPVPPPGMETPYLPYSKSGQTSVQANVPGTPPHVRGARASALADLTPNLEGGRGHSGIAAKQDFLTKGAVAEL